MAESFFATLECELLGRSSFPTHAQARTRSLISSRSSPTASAATLRSATSPQRPLKGDSKKHRSSPSHSPSTKTGQLQNKPMYGLVWGDVVKRFCELSSLFTAVFVATNEEGKHVKQVKRTTYRSSRATMLIAAVVAALAWALLPAVALASPLYPTGTTGYDVSWPNCSATAPHNPSFGIVGVSDGTGYSQNPCLVQEAAWFPSVNLYVNTGWNDQSVYLNPNSPRVCATGDQNCLAYNYGYNAGLYALSHANSQNIHASAWWLDVETSNTWNTVVVQNQNSLHHVGVPVLLVSTSSRRRLA